MSNEKRLIDANAVLEKLSRMIDYCKTDKKVNATTALFQVGDAIMDCPTVDAVEVVHGHMVERIVDHEYPWYTVFDCSECGCSVEKWHNYCPNCGAKMDEPPKGE